MTRSLAFWVIMLVWAIFYLAVFAGYAGSYAAGGSALLHFVLFALLGWNVFGPPLRGG